MSIGIDPVRPGWRHSIAQVLCGGLTVLGVLVADVKGIAAQQPPDVPQPAARVLDSLERAAEDARNPRRLEAVGKIAFEFGNPRSRGLMVTLPGVVDRLARVYQQARSDDRLMRSYIVKAVAVQAEQRDAAAFLANVAREPATRPPSAERSHPMVAHSSTSIQLYAVGGLEGLGDEGVAALRELYRAGSVVEPKAKAYLAASAKRDFRLPPL